MEYTITKELTESIEDFYSRPWNYKSNDCSWSIEKKRAYLDALMSQDDDNLTHFTGFVREGDDNEMWIIDGNNRSVTLLQYMNGADRLYWRVGKDKVVYCHYGKLKRGYRLMTEEECEKFLDTLVTWNIDKYSGRQSQSRKRARSESDSVSDSSSDSSSSSSDSSSSSGPPVCTSLDNDSRSSKQSKQ